MAETHSPNTALHIVYISIIVVLLLCLGGMYYHYHRETEGFNVGMMQRSGMRGRMGGMSMVAATPAPLTAEQQQQLAAGTATTITQKTFTIDGGNFYFSPNKITVNKGDTVTINFKNDGGIHDFVIDALNVKIPVIMTGVTATTTFTVQTTGTYQFYCSVPGHKTRGMVGTLIVQ